MDEGNIPDADGTFPNAPIFNFNDGKVKFDTNFVDNPNAHCGSASGFLPKSLLTDIKRRPQYAETPFYIYFIERIQPPSILPISSICV